MVEAKPNQTKPTIIGIYVKDKTKPTIISIYAFMLFVIPEGFYPGSSFSKTYNAGMTVFCFGLLLK
jgi:hypothetical protein